jgi:hypothetical protein
MCIGIYYNNPTFKGCHFCIEKGSSKKCGLSIHVLLYVFMFTLLYIHALLYVFSNTLCIYVYITVYTCITLCIYVYITVYIHVLLYVYITVYTCITLCIIVIINNTCIHNNVYIKKYMYTQ